MRVALVEAQLNAEMSINLEVGVTHTKTYDHSIFLLLKQNYNFCNFGHLLAIAEVYKNEANDEYKKKHFDNAIYYYTEGIKVSCKDEELNAKLYNNRAAAHFNLGEKLTFLFLRNCFKISELDLCKQCGDIPGSYSP